MLCKRIVKGGHGQVLAGQLQMGSREPLNQGWCQSTEWIPISTSRIQISCIGLVCITVCVCACVCSFARFLSQLSIYLSSSHLLLLNTPFLLRCSESRDCRIFPSRGGAVGFECMVSHTQPAGSPDWRWQGRGVWLWRGERAWKNKTPNKVWLESPSAPGLSLPLKIPHHMN